MAVAQPLAHPLVHPVASFATTAFNTLDEAIGAVLVLAQDILDMGTVYVAEADHAAGCLRIMAVRERENGCGLSDGLEIPLAETVCQRVVSSGEPLQIRDLADDAHAAALPLVIDLDLHAYVSVPILRKDGSPFGTLCGLDRSPMDVSPHEIAWLRIIASVLAFQLEHERLEARLEYQALHDPLTALPNRAALLERLARPRRRAAQGEGRVALLFLDLDNFKHVNDTLGHEAGDQLLIGTAERLLSCARGDDLVARIGGDEMVVLAEHVERPEDAITLASRIIAAFQAPFDLSAGQARTMPSIGIALSDADDRSDPSHHRGPEDLLDLLRRADHAMYRAKAAGKGRFALYDPALDAASPPA